jgi:hypothetical protein
MAHGGSAAPGNEVSGFGHPEGATPVEVCPDGTCNLRYKPSVTDLYCHGHTRFLPFIGIPSGTRTSIAITAVVIGYGLIELTAETGSATGAYVLYSAIFLGFIAVPLRHYARTSVIASLLWLVGSVVPFVARTTTSRFHMIAAAVIVVAAAVAFTLTTLPEASDSIEIPQVIRHRRVGGRDYFEVTERVTVALVIAVWSAVAGVAVLVLPGRETALAVVMLVIAALVFGVGTVIVSVSAAVLGAGPVSTTVPPIRHPGRPTRPSVPGVHDGGTQFDIMVEIFARVLYSVAVTAGYCLVLAGYGIVRAIIAMINLAVRVIVVTARWAWAAIVIEACVIWSAVVAACRGVTLTVVGVLVPASSLLGTPWIVSAAADQTRRYLLNGPIIALGFMSALLLVSTLLLLGAWMILANQHPRESFLSAGRSLFAVGYGFPVVVIGGWLMGVPGSLGVGKIRLGPVTYVLTALIFIGVMLYALRVWRPAQPGPGATAVPGPPAHSGSAWSVCIALTMIAGAVIGLTVFRPKPTPTVGTINILQLRAGDCLTGPGLPFQGTGKPWPWELQAVPCTEQHVAEVVYADNNQWPDTEAFPGYAALVKQGSDKCEAAFTSYDSIKWSDSIYRLWQLVPFTETGWTDPPRELACVAYYPTTKYPNGATMERSIKGSHK